MAQRRLGLLDPSLNSKNTGDQIIAEAVEMELAELLPHVEIVRLPTQTRLNSGERSIAKSVSKFVVGGTNILNGNIPRYIQWKLDPLSYSMYFDRVSTMGVGWWQYQSGANRLSRSIWRGVIGSGANSVRDNYTAERLVSMGIRATNTSCPTTWRLADIQNTRKDAPSTVIMTITDYHRNQDRDRTLVHGLRERYEDVYVWPQGSKDKQYLQSLDKRVRFLGPALKDFDEALTQGSDYVGTRLHAGIRAMQLGAYAVIVAIDNRAAEMSRDIALPIVSNELNASDWDLIDHRRPIALKVPHAAIEQWKRDLVEWLEE